MKDIYLINEDIVCTTLVECLDIENRQVGPVNLDYKSKLYLDELSYCMLIEVVKDLYTETDPDSSYDISIAGCTLEEYRKNYIFIAVMKAFDNFVFDDEIEIVGQMMKEAYQEIYNNDLDEVSCYSIAANSINTLVGSDKIAKYKLTKEQNGYKLNLIGKSIDDWEF